MKLFFFSSIILSMPAQKHKRIVIFLFLFFFFFLFKLDVLAVTLNISGAPATLNEEQEFSLNVNVSGSSSIADKNYYLEIVFTKKDSSISYFGWTKNDKGEWHNHASNFADFYKITMSSEATWSGILQAKPDLQDGSFKGSGDYWLKVFRYTEGGSKGDDDCNQLLVYINHQEPSPSPSPSPSQNPSPSPSSESSSAICQINEAKDKEGNVLSSVKIYIDGVYIHHLVPEMLEFGDGCKCGTECDENIDFNFGQHTIKLSKSGYGDWEETKTINQEEDCDINPVMNLLDIESPSPSPSPSDFSPLPSAQTSPSPKPKPSIKNQTKEDEDFKEASFTGEVFGASESSQKQTAEPAEKKSEKQKHSFLPLIISLIGLSFLGAASFPFIKSKLKHPPA